MAWCGGETIGLLSNTYVPPQVIDDAVAYWSRCANYGFGFPSFVIGEEGTRNIYLEYHPSKVGEKRCGEFKANSIVLYGRAVLVSGVESGCGSIAQNLAHELGHVLGLSDAPENSRCQDYVMSNLNGHNSFTRAVTIDECQAVGQHWMTFEEWSAVPQSRQEQLTGFTVAAR